jgi:hypothetical protein
MVNARFLLEVVSDPEIFQNQELELGAVMEEAGVRAGASDEVGRCMVYECISAKYTENHHDSDWLTCSSSISGSIA